MKKSEKMNIIKKIVAKLEKDYKKIEKMQEKRFEDCSLKQWDKLQANLNWAFMHIDRDLHELHCQCVEIGIAKREENRYGEKTYHPSGWHEYKWDMREPKK